MPIFVGSHPCIKASALPYVKDVEVLNNEPT